MRNCQIEKLKHEMKSLLMENYKLEYWESVKTKSSSLAYSSYQNSNARKKLKDS